jgi:hypothetical protein
MNEAQQNGRVKNLYELATKSVDAARSVREICYRRAFVTGRDLGGPPPSD